MESYGIADNPAIECSTPGFRCIAGVDGNGNDDDDDDSQAIEEHLQRLMNRPLIDDFNIMNNGYDNNIILSLEISGMDRNGGAENNSQLEWNEISGIAFQDESLESVDIGRVVMDTAPRKSNQSKTSLPIHKTLPNSSNDNKKHDKHNRCKVQLDTTNDYSSSSEGTTDEHQNSDHTCPETPPTPLSLESTDHLLSSSLISVQHHHDSHLEHNSTSPTNSFSNPALLLPTPISEMYDASIRSSMAYNPITSHSPRRKSRSRRTRATIGMSLFSCLDAGSDDVISDTEQVRNRSVFRPRNNTVEEDDYGIVSTCDSEEALEHAAQIIRSQLLQSEMLDLAAEAEKAADSGLDRFIRHPVAGVIQEDLIRTSTTTTIHNNDINSNFRRKLSIQAMRRSLSEGSYVPQHATRTSERNKSTTNFVSNIFPDSIIPLTSNYANATITNTPPKNSIALRDVNEVFPTFQSFHTHLRTHFTRGDISPTQLSFHEQNQSDETRNKAMAITGFYDEDDDGSLYSVQRKSTPSRQIHPFCRSEDSPLSSVFSLPLCSNEITSTPLTSHRKIAGNHSQPDFPFPMDPTVPMNNFLQSFRFVDQWSNAISTHCQSSANHLQIEASPSKQNNDEQLHKDLYVINLLSVQLTTYNNVPHVPMKIDMLPDLEYDFVANVLRSATALSSIRLKPKIGHRNIHQDTVKDVFGFDQSLSDNLVGTINDPKALFDETEYDSDEDGGYANVGDDREVLRIHSATEQSVTLNSILDDPALVWTPTIVNTRNYLNNNVADASDNGSDATLQSRYPSFPDFTTPVIGFASMDHNSNSVDAVDMDVDHSMQPPPPLIPDFVTPAKLRKIRGSLNLKRSVNESIESQRKEREKSIETKPIDPIYSSIYAIEETPENDTSATQNRSRCSDYVNDDDNMHSSLTVLDLAQPSSHFCGGVLGRPLVTPDNAVSSEHSPIVSKSDPVMIAWLKEAPILTSLKASKSCRSLDGYIAEAPSQHDCGCLSLSPASSTCSDDDVRRRDSKTTGDDTFTANSLRKVISSGAINDYQSWDAFLERFQAVALPAATMETTGNSTPKRKNSIRDAMDILSSKLSPNRMNDCPSQEKAQEEQRLRVLRENDEFMSNFLYCSKQMDDVTDDITSTIRDVDDDAVSKADRVTSSFLCMDDNMMRCGDTENGYCCNYFFDGALTMGNILVPSSFSVRNRTTSNLSGAAHSHKRVRSFLNLDGGGPASRRESYHTESTNHHNSSSWLDLANDLDGAFDTWVLGETSQTQFSSLNESETCLSHVLFQPPTLKKLRNILEDSASTGDESENAELEYGEYKRGDEPKSMIHSAFHDLRDDGDMHTNIMLVFDGAEFPDEHKTG